MKRQLVFATRNAGKVAELRQLLADVPGLEVLSARDVPGLPEVEEDGDTFVANATKKALAVSRHTGLPALADDSGLEVDALGGAPGVHSARYGGVPHDDARNNQTLLAALAGTAEAARTARFRSALVLADTQGALGAAVIIAEGACEGRILEAPRGEGGFGYDPLFFSAELGMTFAEAGVGPKNQLSHRARAMAALRPKLLAYLRGEPSG